MGTFAGSAPHSELSEAPVFCLEDQRGDPQVSGKYQGHCGEEELGKVTFKVIYELLDTPLSPGMDLTLKSTHEL